MNSIPSGGRHPIARGVTSRRKCDYVSRGANLETLLGEHNAEVPGSAASIVVYLQEVECTTVSTMHTADLPAY